MSVFENVNALEGADDANPESGVAVPEEETATAAVADATAEGQEVAQEDDNAEQLDEEKESLEEVEETVAQESEGLSPVAAKILNTALRNIVGTKHANKIIATENYSSGRGAQREAKQMALEGIKDTLKKFWESIKAQLKKFYNKVKSFFTKVFSAARKLSDRAKKLQEKASSTVGTIEEKSFSFSQTKAIAVDGKYNEAGTLTTGLNNVRKVIDGILSVQKSEKYESVIEEAQTLIEKEVKNLASMAKDKRAQFDHTVFGTGKADSIVSKLNEVGGKGVGVNLKAPEQKLKEMYADKNSKDTVMVSDSLPGGKAIFAVVVAVGGNGKKGADSITELAKAIKNTRILLGSDRYNPRDVTEGEVKTLTTSQIDKVCDDVIEISETSYTYEKAWEKRDKFQAKLEREIDSIIKDVNSDKDDDNDSRIQRVVRDFATSFTTSVRRRTNFEAQFISYALNVASAMLNYSERSLAQHKAK